MRISDLVVVVKQKTAYEMRISDWSSDVCSSDLAGLRDGDDAADAEQRPLDLAALLVVPACPLLILDRVVETQPPMQRHAEGHPVVEIGRASCRESVCQYV